MPLNRSVAALCALAVATPLALAQTTNKPAKPAAAKTLGGAQKPAGKLLSRDELRACLKEQEELSARRASLERDRAALSKERDDVQAAAAAFNEEKVALETRRREAAEAFKKKAAQLQQDVEAYKQRGASLSSEKEGRASALRKERDMAAMEKERVELMQRDQALRAEGAALEADQAQEVARFNEKSQQINARMEQWNERNSALADQIAARQAATDRWESQCANRPYREDDEIAIKAGK